MKILKCFLEKHVYTSSFVSLCRCLHTNRNKRQHESTIFSLKGARKIKAGQHKKAYHLLLLKSGGIFKHLQTGNSHTKKDREGRNLCVYTWFESPKIARLNLGKFALMIYIKLYWCNLMHSKKDAAQIKRGLWSACWWWVIGRSLKSQFKKQKSWMPWLVKHSGSNVVGQTWWVEHGGSNLVGRI